MEQSFGFFLKQKRQEKNLTQKQLADILFVSESAVSKWEKNVAHPDITLLPRLSETLGVSEHELITASIDKRAREEKAQAKKWRNLRISWNMSFYIAYAIAILTCFICNIAVNGTLSWFFIVLSALILSFTFTSLHQYIKKYRLFLIPLSMFLALILLLGVCAIYTNGGWFFVATFSVLLGLVIIFVPIFIAKYPLFSKIKKYNDFISVGIDFVVLNILLIIINIHTSINNLSNSCWYLKLALPIVLAVYLFLNLLMCVRFLKINKLLKTGVVLSIINALYLVLPFIKVKNPKLQLEIDSANIFRANFSNWSGEVAIEQNIHLIVCLTLLGLTILFITFGLIKHFINKNKI